MASAGSTFVAPNSVEQNSATPGAGRQFAGKSLQITGRFPRIAKLDGEFHEFLNPAEVTLEKLKAARLPAHLFTFLQAPLDPSPKLPFHHHQEPIALLPIETHEKWWKQQINDKTRNMIRKAGKKGVEIKRVEFNDELVRGIKIIYDECPLRQGKPFRHYQKDFETLKTAHASYLEQSVFFGAYLGPELIGFIKFILLERGASIMQIISMISHRDKAPTNALLNAAVEECARRKLSYLQYGVWSRKSMGDFKLHHGFQCVEIPRYFVPLNLLGRMALALKLHRPLIDLLPDRLYDGLTNLRAKWYSKKHNEKGL